jgi:hypothetical protein
VLRVTLRPFRSLQARLGGCHAPCRQALSTIPAEAADCGLDALGGSAHRVEPNAQVQRARPAPQPVHFHFHRRGHGLGLVAVLRVCGWRFDRRCRYNSGHIKSPSGTSRGGVLVFFLWPPPNLTFSLKRADGVGHKGQLNKSNIPTDQHSTGSHPNISCTRCFELSTLP